MKGRCSTHPGTDPWSGYLIVQAKFLQRSSGTVGKDGQWVLNQIDQEFKKFTDTKRKLRRPDYFLLVTNVILTPVSKRGTKDRVLASLAKHSASINCKGFDVWDYDKICRLLDNASDVTRRYFGFIATGDVLARILDYLPAHSASFADTISLYLQRELRADQSVKLEQAGHTADQKTALGNVFIDLPAFDQPLADPPEQEEQTGHLQDGIVAEILRVGSSVLRGSASFQSPSVGRHRDDSREPGRYVLIGGPGQGKSTVGQFLCQLYRAAVLEDRAPNLVGAEARSVLNSFAEQCRRDKITLPPARRFPVRIVLDQFATALAKGSIDSVLAYICSRINGSTGEVSISQLRVWLQTYPWFIVLDGLDEVPATSNRREVIEKIVEFWSEAAALDADILVVATTRPQGYNREFSPSLYRHCFLAPLSRTRALHYAARLLSTRFGGELDRIEKVMNRLRVACEQSTTARLMRSPLQVTIMAILVDRIGQPPQDRWRLFQQYYEVIYARETERDIPASRILQQRKADVNSIHHRVGLLLQTEAELAGSTDSKLPLDRFNTLVLKRIASEGYEGQELLERTREITEAALARLVFLVGLEAEKVGFEIRSLQEFMAAEALMDGADQQVRARLEEIATIAHWRNVFLFAAGRAFSDRQHLRDTVIGICDQANDCEADELRATVLAGSRLALDLLEDGLASEQPKFRRQLMRLALRLTELPDAEAVTRLALQYEPNSERAFRDCLDTNLRQEHLYKTLGSWTLLLALIDRDVQWAKVIAEDHWPTDRNQQIRYWNLIEPDPRMPWAASKLAPILPWMRSNTFNVRRSRGTPKRMGSDIPPWYQALFSPAGGEPSEITLFPEDKLPQPIRVTLPLLEHQDWRHLIPLRDMPLHDPSWAMRISAARFISDPTVLNLAQQLRSLSQCATAETCRTVPWTPWPLLAILQTCKSAADLLERADLLDSGFFGSHIDWQNAESRWKQIGITFQDISYQPGNGMPFDRNIGTVGVPSGCRMHVWNYLHPSASIPSLLSRFNQLTSSNGRHLVANIVIDLIDALTWGGAPPSRIRIEPRVLRELLLTAERPLFDCDILCALEYPSPITAEWLDCINWIGLNHRRFFGSRAERTEPIFTAAIDALLAEPQKRGLARIVSTMVAGGLPIVIPKAYWLRSKTVDDRLDPADLILRLSQGGWDATEATILAQSVLHCIPDNPDMYRRVSRVLTVDNLRREDIELFLLTLFYEVRANESDSLRYLVDVLAAQIRGRKSRLHSPPVWESLGLPTLA